MTEAYKDREWLYLGYNVLEMSMRELGDVVNVDPGTIKYWMEKYGIDSRSEGRSADAEREYRDEDWLRREYVENQRPLESIREEMGVASVNAVVYWLDKHGIETRSPQEAGELLRGESHPHWGGVGGEDRRWYNKPEWRRTRKKVYERDGYACQDCGCYGELHAHHIKPISEGGDKLDLDNLVSLCPECHAERHDGKEVLKS